MEKVVSILDSARSTILVADNDSHITQLLGEQVQEPWVSGF